MTRKYEQKSVAALIQEKVYVFGRGLEDGLPELSPGHDEAVPVWQRLAPFDARVICYWGFLRLLTVAKDAVQECLADFATKQSVQQRTHLKQESKFMHGVTGVVNCSFLPIVLDYGTYEIQQWLK